MIKHIVAWNINSGENKEKVSKEIKLKLEDLKNEIDFIQDIEVGINFNKTDVAYDLVLYSEFLTEEDLEAYLIHPAHVKVGGFVKSKVKDRVVIDYVK